MQLTKGALRVIRKVTDKDGRVISEDLKVIYEDMPVCPECGAPMAVRDHIWRWRIGMSGIRGRMWVRRLICTSADCFLHSHPRRNLPEGTVPYRLYDAEVHRAIAEGRRDVPCSPNTPHRILRWLL